MRRAVPAVTTGIVNPLGLLGGFLVGAGILIAVLGIRAWRRASRRRDGDPR